MTEQSKFRFSAVEGMIELEGSEAFVTKQIEDLKDLIAQLTSYVGQSIKQIPAIDEQLHSPEQLPALSPPESSTQLQNNTGAGLTAYPHTFEEMNGTLKVVADIPGESKKAKMRNAALLYGYGSYLVGREVFPSEEIRQVCQDHGCLDGANFSKVFEDKTVFVVEGVKGGKKSVKLSHLGRKQAKQLVDNIESNAS